MEMFVEHRAVLAVTFNNTNTNKHKLSSYRKTIWIRISFMDGFLWNDLWEYVVAHETNVTVLGARFSSSLGSWIRVMADTGGVLAVLTYRFILDNVRMRSSSAVGPRVCRRRSTLPPHSHAKWDCQDETAIWSQQRQAGQLGPDGHRKTGRWVISF